MSSHNLDLSGQRALTVTVNDPARSACTASAKAGDDVIAILGGFREARINIPPNARIERRLYVNKKQVLDENNRAVKDDDGKFVYKETPYESFVLVLSGSLTVFARSSAHPGDETDPPVYEMTPAHVACRSTDDRPELHRIGRPAGEQRGAGVPARALRRGARGGEVADA